MHESPEHAVRIPSRACGVQSCEGSCHVEFTIRSRSVRRDTSYRRSCTMNYWRGNRDRDGMPRGSSIAVRRADARAHSGVHRQNRQSLDEVRRRLAVSTTVASGSEHESRPSPILTRQRHFARVAAEARDGPQVSRTPSPSQHGRACATWWPLLRRRRTALPTYPDWMPEDKAARPPCCGSS